MKKKITSVQYNKIALIFNKAMANKTSHIKNRVKRSGAVTIQEGKAVKSSILSPDSEKLNEIEKILHSLIKT